MTMMADVMDLPEAAAASAMRIITRSPFALLVSGWPWYDHSALMCMYLGVVTVAAKHELRRNGGPSATDQWHEVIISC